MDYILKDNSFLLQSDCAKRVLVTAKTIFKWIKLHQSEAEKFEETIVASLNTCLHQPQVKSTKINRERMWCAYHKLRTSDTYIAEWKRFVKGTMDGINDTSMMFCQCATDYIFKELIKLHHPLNERKDDASNSQSPLTYMETNAVRYAAGYIPRSLNKTLLKSSHPLKKDLILCLCELIDEDNSEPTVDDSTDWLQKIDRGGLIKVKNDTFELFIAMEHKLRAYITVLDANNDVPSFSDGVKEDIALDPDVQLIWHLLSGEWEEESSAALLKMIISEWVKIRGFSYTSAWVEKYKATEKKTIQKSKGLRKQLQST